MPDTNIFQDQTTDQQKQTTSSDNSFADLLGSIKNERGEPKYKDVQTALDALKHSQDFIPQLKTEKEQLEIKLANLQKEVERLSTVEDTVTKLTSGQSQQATQTPTGLSAEEVANLVTQTLSQRETKATQDANLKVVVSQLQESFGKDAEVNFYSKAKELGMSVEEMNTLAAKSPQAVFKILGIEKKQEIGTTRSTSTKPSINTAGYQPQNESLLGRNKKPVILGASTEELHMERDNSNKLVEELHNQGLSTYDLTDPKTYFKYFGKS